jgi:hypothetical protein
VHKQKLPHGYLPHDNRLSAACERGRSGPLTMSTRSAKVPNQPDLPVQQATKFELIVNVKAAKQIGLTIPVNVLKRANQVIK